METSGYHRTQRGSVTHYRIVGRGELSERLATAFEGMHMETRSGHTILTGELDQPHVHGILDRVGALGLKLVSVDSAPAEDRAGGLR